MPRSLFAASLARVAPFSSLVTPVETARSRARRSASVWLGAALGLLALVGSAQATTVTLADGTLSESANAQTGVGIQQALGSEFTAANAPMTFSGTLAPSSTSTIRPGAYNLGMTVGNVYFLVHPGFGGGAFRYDPVNLSTSLVSPFGYTGNIGIGFTPTTSPLDFEVVLTAAGSNFSVAVDITQTGVGSFQTTFALAQSAFGTGGDVSSFGAFHNGFGTGFGTLDYSDFTASVASVPLPAGVPLLLAALGGFGIVARRRTVR